MLHMYRKYYKLWKLVPTAPCLLLLCTAPNLSLLYNSNPSRYRPTLYIYVHTLLAHTYIYSCTRRNASSYTRFNLPFRVTLVENYYI